MENVSSTLITIEFVGALVAMAATLLGVWKISRDLRKDIRGNMEEEITWRNNTENQLTTIKSNTQEMKGSQRDINEMVRQINEKQIEFGTRLSQMEKEQTKIWENIENLRNQIK